MKNKLVALILAVSATFFTVSFGYAQGALGDLRGTVTDSAGAVVAGANIEVKNQETNETRTTTSNEKGEYVLSKLNVGSYTVTANAQGFAPTSIKDVRISVAFVTEQNVTIGAAGTQASVTVTSGDAATQLNQTDQQLSTIITNRKINDLPLLSRDPSSLVLLSPGTVQTDTTLGGFSINGSRERNNNFIVDGVDNNDTDVPGIPGGVATPNIDATEEFRVITGNFNAEYGRNTGGIVTTATKRGTNDFHGGAYIYYRSDKFAARNFFDTTGEADPLDRKQFGGSIGGPIWKNKWFFFFNYEGMRTKSGGAQYRLVPTALARTGIIQTPEFGTLDIRPGGANNGTGIALFGDPSFNLPFSPTSQALLNALFPLPNYPANGAVQAGSINGVLQGSVIPGAFELYTFGYTARDHSNSVAFRSDLKINDKHSLTFSANYNKGDFSFGAPTFDTFNDELRTPQLGGVYSLNLLSAFSSSMVNELRVGTNRIDSTFYGPGSGNVSNAINEAVRRVFNTQGVAYPNFGSANASNLNLTTSFTSINNFSTQGRKTGTTTIGDSFTWVRGNHTFKFGGEGRFVYSNGDSNFFRQEALDFGLAANFAFPIVINEAQDDFISPFGSGGIINDYLSFLSGIVATQTQIQYFNGSGQRIDNDFRRYRTNEYGLFAQDTWKIRPDLTLNFGLRWDYATVPYEKNGLLANLIDQDPSGPTPAGGFVFKTVGKNSSNPDITLYDKDWNNFGPRVGFAYSPGFDSGGLGKLFGGPGKSSFRGGYGVFYDRVFTNLFSNSSTNPPFSGTSVIIPLNEPGDFTIDGLTRIPTLTATNTVVEGAEATAVLFPTSKNNILQQKFVIPSSATWNFGYQRQFGSDLLIEIDYVGTRGYHLIRDVNAQLTSVARTNALLGRNVAVSPSLRTNYLNGSLNTAFGQSSAFLIISTGNSEYNAMQTRITKTLNSDRWGHGQLQAFYTWSHSIDDAPDSLVTGTSDRSLPRDSSGFTGGLRAERGDSSFDARHRFVFNAIYDIPLRFNNKWMNRLLGNWTISGIYQAQTGYPFSIFANGVDTQGTGQSARATFNTRSDRLTPTLTADNARIYTGPDRSLFLGEPCANGGPSDPNSTAGCTPLGVPYQGNVGRSTFRGPKFSKVDFSIIKRFPISESMRFTIRADFFNLFNTVNLNTPISDVLDPNFGVSTAAGSARIIQFAGRFDF